VGENAVVPGDPAMTVRTHTRLAPVRFVPEIQLYQADHSVGLWDVAGTGGYRSDVPAPFWAFAWAGGQALARYVLDHPQRVAGRQVLDLASGSGLVAVAAARAGAAEVRAVDVDPVAVAAIGMNAAANRVRVVAECADILEEGAGGADVVLAGDAFYSGRLTERVVAFLRRAGRDGARVFAGDPDREFIPRHLFRELATYEVPVTEALEEMTVKHTTLWELPANGARS
jgi:predicted nicotinamide N-methyase